MWNTVTNVTQALAPDHCHRHQREVENSGVFVLDYKAAVLAALDDDGATSGSTAVAARYLRLVTHRLAAVVAAACSMSHRNYRWVVCCRTRIYLTPVPSAFDAESKCQLGAHLSLVPNSVWKHF